MTPSEELPCFSGGFHRTASDGLLAAPGRSDSFEVAHFSQRDDGLQVTGCTTAVENHHAWIVDYDLRLDATWRTRAARVSARSAGASGSVILETDGLGRWNVDGAPSPELDGCLNVDLESSALTNAFPVHRLALPVGDRAAAPAALVRCDLSIKRLEQDYRRLDADDAHHRFEYRAPGFGFACLPVYDTAGLVLEYPGIAARAE